VSVQPGMVATAAASVLPPVAVAVSQGPIISLPVESRYSFDNFIVGKSNELAYNAAQAVAEPGVLGFNPLFLHGTTGLGKTHLMHAIGNAFLARQPDAKVAYMSAEKFMVEFLAALRAKDTIAFKQRLRSVDLLMIDDVQFIAGKESTQEEFFHTMNEIISAGKRLVITADRSPQNLEGIQERILSRMAWGLVADINPADYELRLNILHAKLQGMTQNIAVPGEVIEFLARKITANVRELEGALNRVIAYAALVGKPVTLEFTRETLADLLRAHEKKLTIDEIQRKVAEHYRLKLTDLLSARRAREVARPRQVAMYLAKKLTPRSLPEIGRRFGGRDHTTVMHAVKRIEELRASDREIDADVGHLTRLLDA
jgi:chromosomal replication initiator protein